MHTPSTETEKDARGITVPWIYIAGESVLPLLIGALLALIFLKMPQAREALFGTIGNTFAPTAANLTAAPRPEVSSQFLSLGVGIATFALAIWYCSRLLVTVHTSPRAPKNDDGEPPPDVSVPTEHFPRILGAVAAALLVAAVVNAQDGYASDISAGPFFSALAAFMPLAIVAYILHWRRRPWKAVQVAAIGFALVLHWLCVALTQRPPFHFVIEASLTLLCYVPAILYVATWFRRNALRRLGRHPGTPSAQLRTAQVVRRFVGLALGSALMLAALTFAPVGAARWIGSSAIVTFFATAVLLLASAFSLKLRRWSYKVPGIVLVIGLGALALYALTTAVTGSPPIQEHIGHEKLAFVAAPAVAPRPDTALAPDIAVNAYGGGLRAGVFTAQVLADLDDRSCGRFGNRLSRMSGVSGGSLGIAVYMTMRQELVANGGWPAACTAGVDNEPLLRSLVEAALLQDHMSPVLTRMFTSDILPGLEPRRGAALLESWQDAVVGAVQGLPTKSAEVSLQGLARPLHMLDGGIRPAPLVFFNSTDARTGARFWMSNKERWGGPFEVRGDLGQSMQVGQAVLHSARFPVVSPAGSLKLSSGTRTLVDAGYADNSGVGTLMDSFDAPGERRGCSPPQRVTTPKEKFWLSLDGNPPRIAPELAIEEAGEAWTAVGALLAVRRQNAHLAVHRFKGQPIEYISLQLDLDSSFAPTIPAHKRAEFLKGLRSAPLGWYMSRKTVGDQNQAIRAAVTRTCTAITGLCDDSPITSPLIATCETAGASPPECLCPATTPAADRSPAQTNGATRAPS